ncbi:MAG: hypothetical protein HYZ00_03590, partial [Candidatus Hydrogenedentes bacterium]|nr:hypothetical protein [Candidatus Hydrogenedentota bacterium]
MSYVSRLVLAITLAAPAISPATTLFPVDLPRRDWTHFTASGFSEPVCGVVYRLRDTVTNGMALGGVDTGCIDLETSGLLGYSTIFNSHVPRRGPINLPVLGVSVGGETWVLCEPEHMKQGWGSYQAGADGQPIPKVWADLQLEGVQTPKEIHYWGHYPVADLEFEMEAPVSVSLRAWAPFLPGDAVASMLPGIVFEVRVRNVSSSPQAGAVAFSFPGPTPQEAGSDQFERTAIEGKVTGVTVRAPRCSYALTALHKKSRSGGELGANGAAWAAIERELPSPDPAQPGASAAVDFKLRAGEERVVRFVLAWHAPEWNGVGFPGATENYPKYSGAPREFTHMYVKHYPDPAKTAELLAARHEELLERVLAWQQVIYTENALPVWLRDSLVNVLYLITEDGLWAQK